MSCKEELKKIMADYGREAFMLCLQIIMEEEAIEYDKMAAKKHDSYYKNQFEIYSRLARTLEKLTGEYREEPMEVKNSKPLLELAFLSLFTRHYAYSPPQEDTIVLLLKGAGIENPIEAMEQWRREEGFYTDSELSEKGEE